MPSPNYSRITKRQVGLDYGIVLQQVFPILSYYLSKEASFVDVLSEIVGLDAWKHGVPLREVCFY
jgi:hypothetical protein